MAESIKDALRIVLVEDNPGDEFLFREALQSSGKHSQITVLQTGQQTLNYFRLLEEHHESPLPHIVVLDLHLPDMESYPVLEFLKNSERLKSIPVIVLSSSDDQVEIAKAYDAKADFYVVKPA